MKPEHLNGSCCPRMSGSAGGRLCWPVMIAPFLHLEDVPASVTVTVLAGTSLPRLQGSPVPSAQRLRKTPPSLLSLEAPTCGESFPERRTFCCCSCQSRKVNLIRSTQPGVPRAKEQVSRARMLPAQASWGATPQGEGFEQ